MTTSGRSERVEESTTSAMLEHGPELSKTLPYRRPPSKEEPASILDKTFAEVILGLWMVAAVIALLLGHDELIPSASMIIKAIIDNYLPRRSAQ